MDVGLWLGVCLHAEVRLLSVQTTCLKGDPKQNSTKDFIDRMESQVDSQQFSVNLTSSVLRKK